MDYSSPAFTEQSSQPSRLGEHLLTALLLILSLLVGTYFRTINLSDWDGGTGHHPDERFMHYTVVNLQAPSDWRTYFVSSCPSPMPFPRNSSSPPEQWEPSAQSGCSTLNPRNFVTWSGGYVYGTLPTTLTRLIVDATGRTDIHQTLVVGRALSAGADLLTLLALFFLAHLLYGRYVALLAAALYAGAVMPIQQSHFFTVDQFAVCFGTLALLFATRLGRFGRWYDGVLTGVFIAAATASKINMGALVGLVFVALAQVAWSRFRRQETHSSNSTDSNVVRIMARSVGLLVLTGVVTFAAFRIFQPDAFAGPNIWNIGLEERFKERLGEARLTANGTIDLPSSHQWADRTPWLFPWTNMVVWGMGLPLGLAGWLAWAAAGWQLATRRKLVHLVPWVWIGVYFAWQGQQFVTTMRYFLPIYPPLVMFAAWGLISIFNRIRSIGQNTADPAWFGRSLSAGTRQRVRIGLIVGVLAATWTWAWSYTRIYTQTYTRVAATDWLEQNAPDDTTTTWEIWDDPLPRPGELQITTYPYAEEEIGKYIGSNALQLGSESDAGLIRQIGQADYVVLTSPRIYGSVARVPQRFPATLRYYQGLFDGSLGFELAADIHSFPSLFGLPLNDQAAEEAFWVYDHPRVLIFQRTDAFSFERAQRLITEGIVWDEIYRGLRPAQINTAPTALQLTATAWSKLQNADTSYLFRSPLHPALALIVWLLAIEALGLIVVGLIWRLRLPLADRGLSLAPMVGLLLFALLPSLIGATQQIAVGRWLLFGWFGLMLIIGLLLLWRERREIQPFVRSNLNVVLAPRLLYGAIFAAGLALVTLSNVLPNEAIARWNAIVRSPTLPPYDPLFAGGLDPLPYAAQLPFALLDRLLGILPTTGFLLALPTTLALATVGLWSVLYNSNVVLVSRLKQHVLIATGGSLLLVFSGWVVGGMAQLSAWGLLLTSALDTLGLAALATTALGMGVALLHIYKRQHHWRTILIVALPLVFLRSYGLAPLLAVWLAIGVIAIAGLRGDWQRWLHICLPILALALLLGQPFAWSVATPAMQQAPFALSSAALLLGLLVPLVLLAAWAILVGPRLAERWLLQLVGGVVLGWMILAAVLRLPMVLLTVPPLMAMSWLAVQAWVPGWGPRRWRTGIIPAVTALSLVLFILSGLALMGRIANNAQHLFVVASVLFVCAAGWALPLAIHAVAARFSDRSLGNVFIPGGAIAALLVIGLSLAGVLSNVDAAQSDAEVGSASLAAAGRWLAASTTPASVVVTAPQSTLSPVIRESGNTTLIAAPDDARRRRDVVQPAVNGVIDGRLRAIDAIYGGDVARAREALRAYQVEYVVVGPNERTAFGEQAGTALEVMAERGDLETAYNEGEILLYKAAPSTNTPPFVLATTSLQLPETKSLMLNQPVNSLPIVDEYGWNTLATRYQAFGIGLWLLLIEVLGLLAYPFVSRIFRRWPDRGWGLSKLVGLLVWGYVIWLPVNLGWWQFNWMSLVFGGVVLTLVGLLFVRLKHSSGDGESQVQFVLTPILRAEAVFLVAFGVWALVRAANPDVWHPYYGGEKPFEFGFLNAILRSPVLPPYDPFFSDGIVNYYYYGLYLVALPIKATGIDPAIGFNLALATLFAFTCAGGFSVGQQLTGRVRYGLLAILFMVGIGTLASVVEVNESDGLVPVVAALREGVQGFGSRIGAWFWGPSRVIPNTINEFPLFGFLFADLHPHLIALPITLVAIACAAELTRRRQTSRATWALSALVLGTLAVANSWDAPTYALLIGGAIVGRKWHMHRSQGIERAFSQAAIGAVLAVAMTLVGIGLYLPFFLHYQAMVGGIGLVRRGDTVLQYILVYGPLLWLTITLLGTLTWASVRHIDARWRTVARGGAIGLPLLLAILFLSAGALQTQPDLSSGWPLRVLLGLLGGLGVGLALTLRLREGEWMSLWLVTVGLLVGLGTQIVFVQDHLSGGDWERMNTVFKFGVQQWTLWAIGGATGVALIFRLLRRYEITTGIWLGMLIMLLLACLVYPLVGIPSRLSTRFDTGIPLTLDGLAFMERAQYSIERDKVVKQIDLSADAEAIRWLKQNVAGTPIVATSEAEFYRTYGVRIAANTGLPTILGRLHEDEQRPAGPVVAREQDVQELFNTTDPLLAAQLLGTYRVDYVYVGPVEQAVFEPAGLAKFETMRGGVLDLVYENTGVRIYDVKREAISGALYIEQDPQVATEDPQVVALRAQVAANPQDSGLAFGLGQRLVELNRVDEAVNVLQIAAAANSQDVPLHHFLGDLQAQLGQDDAAIQAWQQAIDAQPTASNINKLGQGLVRLGRWEQAERVLQQALAADASFVDPYVYLGELYRSRNGDGDRERAIAAYQRYLELAPADAPWRQLATDQLRELGR